MPRCPEIAGLAALLLAAPAGGQAGESPFAGGWCTDDGESMLIEEGSIGFNEHTVCDLPVALPEDGPLQAELSCRNIYFDGDTEVVAMRRTVEFLAKIADGGLLVAMSDVTRADDEHQPTLWRRCEN